MRSEPATESSKRRHTRKSPIPPKFLCFAPHPALHFFHRICVYANQCPSRSVRPSTCLSFILFHPFISSSVQVSVQFVTNSKSHRYSIDPCSDWFILQPFPFGYTSTHAYDLVPGLPPTSLPLPFSGLFLAAIDLSRHFPFRFVASHSYIRPPLWSVCPNCLCSPSHAVL